MDLNFNKIRRLSDILNGFRIERFVDALCAFTTSNSPTLHVSVLGNPFICDCLEFNMIRLFRNLEDMTVLNDPLHFLYDEKFTLIDGVYCSEPISVFNLKTNSVPLSLIGCDITSSCPAKCKCTKLSSTLTIAIDCASKYLTQLPDSLPQIKQSSFYKFGLNFSGNSIKSLDFREYINQTRFFDISRSGVSDIAEEMYKIFPSLDFIDLSGNSIKEFPENIKLLDFNSTVLDFRNNPIDCTCDEYVDEIVDDFVREVI